jgi:hypothetical protein
MIHSTTPKGIQYSIDIYPDRSVYKMTFNLSIRVLVRDADFNHSDLIELKTGVKFMNFIRKFPVKFIPLKMTYDL